MIPIMATMVEPASIKAWYRSAFRVCPPSPRSAFLSIAMRTKSMPIVYSPPTSPIRLGSTSGSGPVRCMADSYMKKQASSSIAMPPTKPPSGSILPYPYVCPTLAGLIAIRAAISRIMVVAESMSAWMLSVIRARLFEIIPNTSSTTNAENIDMSDIWRTLVRCSKIPIYRGPRGLNINIHKY